MRARLRLHQRAALRALSVLGRLTTGYDVPFLADVVAQYGLRGAMARLGTLEKIVAVLEAAWGTRDAHHLIGFAALYNGCHFCALGHIYAANLVHFRDTGAVFPLDERALRERMRVDDDRQLLDFVRARLTDPTHAGLVALLERQFQLKVGEAPHPALGTAPAGSPTERVDDLLAMTITAYDWLNHCSLASGTGESEVVSLIAPLHRDRALRRRYDAARAAAR